MHETAAHSRQLAELADTNPEALGAGVDSGLGFKYIDLSSVSAGKVDWNLAPEVTLLSAPSRACRVLRHGDVLFGTVRPNLQSHGIVEWHGDGLLVGSTGFSVIRARRGVSSPRYLYHCIMSNDITTQANRDAVGSSYPALNDSDVRRFTVYAPPFGEQVAIAEVLDTLDTTIRQTEAIIEKLKQVKQGLLHDLLTRGIDDNGELRPPQSEAPHLYKESALGWIPWKWSTPSIAEIKAELIDGDRGANYPGADDYRHKGFCVFLSAQNVTSEGFRFYTVQFIDETRHRLLRNGAMNRGDIAVTTRGTLGNVGHFDGAVPFDVVRINSGMAIIRSHDDRLSNSFLYEYLRSKSGQRQYEVGSYGSAQPQLNLDILRNLRLALPSITEQDGIQKHALTAQTLISNEGDALNKLRLLKSGLMDDLLTGRVRVTSLLLGAPA